MRKQKKNRLLCVILSLAMVATMISVPRITVRADEGGNVLFQEAKNAAIDNERTITVNTEVSETKSTRFSFTLTEPGWVSFNLKQQDNNDSVVRNIWLPGIDNIGGDVSSKLSNYTTDEVGLKAGTYWLEVDSYIEDAVGTAAYRGSKRYAYYDNGMPYKFTILFNPSSVTEEENNDIAGNNYNTQYAKRVVEGACYSGNINSYTDNDLFKLSLAEDRKVNVHFTYDNLGSSALTDKFYYSIYIFGVDESGQRYVNTNVCARIRANGTGYTNIWDEHRNISGNGTQGYDISADLDAGEYVILVNNCNEQGCYQEDVFNAGGNAKYHFIYTTSAPDPKSYDDDSEEYDEPDVDDNNENNTSTVEPQADNEQLQAFVTRMYSVVLGRTPDEAGLDDWTNRLESGEAQAVDIVSGFFNSDEYKNMAKSNGEIVTDCYNAMLGREPDEGGYNDWVTRLDNGMSVNAILAGFVGSQEFGNLCDSYGIQPGTYNVTEARDQNQGVTAFVARLYTQALGRGYDVDGLNDWSGQINANPSRENVLYVSTTGFLDSQEFVNKNLDNTEYVKVLYRTYLGREYDDDGLADWVGQLDRGENTRDGVAAGFAYSQEFNGIMAQYGL
ncbi:MAG: DUF4214 domain-containing protein [Lachnospiraceae bacterium]|nr:DUF4214 domain-containing protein [Lachnospiraceae bacterium]